MSVTHHNGLLEGAALIQALAEGDRKAISAIYEQYFPRVEKYIRRNTGSTEEAMDVFQDALMVIYHKAQTPGFELRSKFFTYMYAVCRNLWLDKLKKKRRTEVMSEQQELLTDDASVESDIMESGRRNLYQQKFLLLSADCQKLLKMFFDGQSMRSIGAYFQTSENYIRKKKYKCKERLQKLIVEDPLYTELRHG